MTDHVSDSDKTRLCPSCRMSISVLATKCRYCGEVVGRPKDETRTLSIDDLGGEQTSHYAPSSNVMEALEAFRSDEEVYSAQEDVEQGRQKQKGGDAYQKKTADAGIPDLDTEGRALASLALPSRRLRTAKKPEKPSWMRQVFWMGSFVATVIIIWFGAPRVVALIRNANMPAPKIIRVPERVYQQFENFEQLSNKADGIAIANARAAVEAMADVRSQGTNDEVEAAAATARNNVEAVVMNLLNARDWTHNNLKEASTLLSRAGRADPNEQFRALKKLVDDEMAAYDIILIRIEDHDGTPLAVIARRGPMDPGTPREESVAENENLRERFDVYFVGPKQGLKVRDTLRANRAVQFATDGRILGPGDPES